MLSLVGAVVGAGMLLTTLVSDVAVEQFVLPPGGTFFDDDGNVHEGAIEAIAEQGITRGCGEPDLYCPDDPVTRGQMAALLVRAIGLPPSDTDPFVDDDGSVFERDIAALHAAGITGGCDDGLFCPQEEVTRAQMAAFLVRAFELPPSDADPFVDDDGSVFERDIAALAAVGWTNGCNPPASDRYCLDEPVRRDQMASFLARALGLSFPDVPERPAISMAFTGDILIHSQLTTRAAANGNPYDFGPMFDPIAPIIGSADLAICHLEVPLSEDNTGLSGYPRFNAPRQVADAIAGAGYDGCSTASNHSIDQGVQGVVETLRVMEEAGLGQAGMAVTEAESGRATMYTVDGLTVAHLSATWWLNGLQLPADKPWLVQMLDADELLAQADDARDSGADIVVVSIHCCTEYQTAPTSYQRDVARSLIQSPNIDLVVGHHAHVVQPIEKVDDEYIVYGLGNFLSGQRRRPATQDGVVVTAEFALRGDRWVARGLTANPTWVEGRTYRILEAGDHNGASWSRTAWALRLYGAEGVSVVR